MRSPYRTTAIALMASASLALGACNVEQTEEGELPEVDVDARAGNLPEYEVEGPDVRVERETVEVPYPDVDVDVPEDDEDY